MPYAIQWFLDKEILTMGYSGSLTIEEMTLANDEVKASIKDIKKPIYLISILEKDTDIPIDLNFYLDNTIVRGNNFKMGIVIGAPRILIIISKVVSKITNVKLRALSSFDEALDIIAMQEPSLSEQLSIKRSKANDSIA